MSPTTAAYTAPTASTGEKPNPYMATGTPTGTGVGVPRPGSEAQKTFTGAPEPETTTTTTTANVQEVPIHTGITETDSGAGAGAQHFEEPETIDTSTGTNGDNGKDKGGKLPFKEQVKAYAKVHRGTLLGNKQQKQVGQKILAGEISPVEGESMMHK